MSPATRPARAACQAADETDRIRCTARIAARLLVGADQAHLRSFVGPEIILGRAGVDHQTHRPFPAEPRADDDVPAELFEWNLGNSLTRRFGGPGDSKDQQCRCYSHTRRMETTHDRS